jgi:hypothetical protein
VPVAAGGQRVDLTLRVIAPYRVQVYPYPFVRASLPVTLTARELPDRRYGSPQDAASAYQDAPTRELAVEVVAG